MQTVWRGQCNSSLNIFLEYKDDKSASVCHQLSRAGEKGNLHVERLKLALVFSSELQQYITYHFLENRPPGRGFGDLTSRGIFFLFLKVAKFFFFILLLLSEVLTLLGMTSPEGRRCSGAGNNHAVLEVSEDTSLSFSLSLSGPLFSFLF